MKKIILTVSCLAFVLVGTISAKEVPINPITPDIREKVKESRALVSKVEDSMGPKVMDLEKIYKTFNETCKGNKGDRGCAEIQNQIREKYKDVLQTMANDLPKLKSAVASTAQDLGGSIKAKTRRKDIRELYKHVSEKGAPPKVRGPLSKKLSGLLNALGPSGMNVSILELSLQTQSDMIAATEILEYVEARISSQLVMLDVIQDFGVLSPEMAKVMNGVAELVGINVEFEPGMEVDEKELGKDDWRN